MNTRQAITSLSIASIPVLALSGALLVAPALALSAGARTTTAALAAVAMGYVVYTVASRTYPAGAYHWLAPAAALTSVAGSHALPAHQYPTFLTALCASVIIGGGSAFAVRQTIRR